MHQDSPSASVLGMDMFFTTTTLHPESYVTERTVVFDVTKVQKSGDGFRTPTGTTRVCGRCKELDRGVSGVEPYERATWLLTGETRWFEERRYETLALCTAHFKEFRNRGGSDQGVDVSGYMDQVAPVSDLEMAFLKTASPHPTE